MDREPTRRLWVIDPSTSWPETEGVAQVLHGWSGESRVLQPAISGDGPGPADGHDVDAVALLGSRASVHDDLPWLAKLRDWLRPIVEGRVRIPLLGVCFGHQLIASLAGAEVGNLDPGGAKRVGIEETTLDDARLLPGVGCLRVVVSHREEVKSVPEGYRTVARRPACAIDGLEHFDLPIFTVQFHPEARGDFLQHCGLSREALDDRLIRDSRTVLDAFHGVKSTLN